MPGAHDAHPSTAAVADHPMHPALAPLPTGAATFAFVTDVLAARTGDVFWARCSRWLLRTALATGMAAAPLGTLDLLTIPAARRLPSAWVHGGGNGVVLLLMLSEVLRRRDRFVRASEASPARTGVALGILGITGWLGGELSYRHRIGVMRRQGASPVPRPVQGASTAHPPAQAPDPAPATVAGVIAVPLDRDAGGVRWAAAAARSGDHPGDLPQDPELRLEDHLAGHQDGGMPRDGAVDGSVVSAAPTGPGGFVSDGTAPGDGSPAVPARAAEAEPALDPGTADAIARELARTAEPVEGARDPGDVRPWPPGEDRR